MRNRAYVRALTGYGVMGIDDNPSGDRATGVRLRKDERWHRDAGGQGGAGKRPVHGDWRVIHTF